MILQFPKHLFSMTMLLFLLSISLPAASALSLSGTAFQDADCDGFFSPGEQAAANATIRLSQQGDAIFSAITNESGQYSFANLSPGSYELAAEPISGANLTAPGAGRYEVTLSDRSGSGLDWGFPVPGNVSASIAPRTYPIMHLTPEDAILWSGQYNASARAYLSPEIAGQMTSAPVASFSLLDRLRYTPSERDQGTCGNCWAWAGTGVMELDHARQKGISDRLSLQYLVSNYNGGCGDSGACCGGWLSDLAGFYQSKGIIVPWSNSNAHYRDGRQDCGACSLVSAYSISAEPHYDLSAISVNTIPTQKLTEDEAISNIKNVLLQGKGIWFAYYLPDKSAWDKFFAFWGNQPESAVWKPDSACGKPFDYQNGGGHAVLCVGYDESDPDNRYWIMLNSWGSTAGRPAGLFRMRMDMNYDCSYGDIGYAFYWMTLDMNYPAEENLAPQTPSQPQGPLQGPALSSLSYTASTNDPEGDPVRFSFDWGDGTTSETVLAISGQAAASYEWKKAGAYQITVRATDEKGASSGWSEALSVAISEANRRPLRPDKPQGSKAGAPEKSYGYVVSAIDPDDDDLQITFDWGDKSTSETEFVKSGTEISLAHAWQQPGTYYVRARATDRWGKRSVSSTYLTVRIGTNRPPKKPSSPMGTTSGYTGKSYSFKGYTTDPNQDQIVYTFDWGDGSTSQSDLVNSGALVQMPHSWSQAGAYQIRIKARDGDDAESLWSASKTVKINEPPARSDDRQTALANTKKAGQVKGTCPCSKRP